jgi:curved DNA-binding protein CbpA
MSAYTVLGVPGNASAEDIKSAFQRAQLFYSPEKMAQDPQAAGRFSEVAQAYKVLSDPGSRAAHDRKLASQAALPVARAPLSARTSSTPNHKSSHSLLIIGVLTLAVLACGGWLYYKREMARAEVARQQAIAQGEKERAQAQAIYERARADELAARQEKQLRQEADQSLARAQAAQVRQNQLQQAALANERYEAQRKEQERRADEQRRVAEGQRRLAADKQRIRELCYQNYRRPDC